jgi:hypothetical protein
MAAGTATAATKKVTFAPTPEPSIRPPIPRRKRHRHPPPNSNERTDEHCIQFDDLTAILLVRLSRALVMGAVPMCMLLVMMQLSAPSSYMQNATSSIRRTGGVEDISIAALSDDQQGLWNLKIALSDRNPLPPPEEEERFGNRAWKFSLAKVISAEDAVDPNVSTAADNSIREGHVMMVSKTIEEDLVNEHLVLPADDQGQQDEDVALPGTHPLTSAQAQEEQILQKNPDLSMEVEPIRTTSAASTTLTRSHQSAGGQSKPSTTRRLLGDEHVPASVQGYMSNADHVAQPGTQLYSQSTSRAVEPKFADVTTGTNLWQSEFAKPRAIVEPQYIPEGHAEIVPPAEKASLFAASPQTSVEEQLSAVSSSLTYPPIMYTFYSPIEDGRKQTGMSPEANDLLLTAWKQEWSQAGWEPRVITIETAMKHADFEKLNKKLSSLEKAISTYDRYCFVRWLAMVVVTEGTTGGWMSDYDTFPLHSMYGNIIPNAGRLTVHEKSKNGGVPSLVSGSSVEWDRMAKELIHNAYMRRDQRFWSDMFALHDVYVSSGKTMYVMEHHVTPAQVVMLKHGVEERTCRRTMGMFAIHFSHYALENGNLEGLNATDVVAAESLPERRAAFAQEWLKTWRELCVETINQEPVAL